MPRMLNNISYLILKKQAGPRLNGAPDEVISLHLHINRVLYVEIFVPLQGGRHPQAVKEIAHPKACCIGFLDTFISYLFYTADLHILVFQK